MTIGKGVKQFAAAAVLSAACLTSGQAQVAPGAPNFSAFDSHTVDSVNLMNNNVLLTIPVFKKDGAFPVTHGLAGNSYAYLSSTSWNTATYSYPLIGAANGTLTSMANGFGLTSSTVTIGVLCPNGNSTVKFSNWVVTLVDGTAHPFSAGDYTDSLGCLKASFTDTALDGSGYILSVTKSTVNYVRTSSGVTLGTAGTITDINGNTASINYSSGAITDTLGLVAITDHQTTWPKTFTWTDALGGAPQVSETSTSLSLLSNFGCSGKTELNISSTPIATGLSFPDGTAMALSYEGTPGHVGNYTGRIKMITLRGGGTVTYTYGGSNNGIDCAFQTVPVLTRTLGNGDQTTYTLTHSVTTSPYYNAVNTVIDPAGNKTVYTFTGFNGSGNLHPPSAQVVTEVQKYQGSSTLLTTDVYCYNVAFSSCSFSSAPSALVSYPITSIIVLHQISGMSSMSANETHYDSYGNVTYSAAYDFGASSPTRATTTLYGSWNGSSCVAISNVLNKPCNISVTEGVSSRSNAYFSYDSTGNLTTSQVWNGTTWLSNSTLNTYNSNGTPSATYDFNNNPTTFAYSSSGYVSCGSCTQYPFPTSITTSGLTTSSTWNGVGGGVLLS